VSFEIKTEESESGGFKIEPKNGKLLVYILNLMVYIYSYLKIRIKKGY